MNKKYLHDRYIRGDYDGDCTTCCCGCDLDADYRNIRKSYGASTADACERLLKELFTEEEDSTVGLYDPVDRDMDTVAPEPTPISTKFLFNPSIKTTTYIPSSYEMPVVLKAHPDDDFDKYVGAALAYVYSEFGSKTAFRKFVDTNSKTIKSREERKEMRKAAKKHPASTAEEAK